MDPGEMGIENALEFSVSENDYGVVVLKLCEQLKQAAKTTTDSEAELTALKVAKNACKSPEWIDEHFGNDLTLYMEAAVIAAHLSPNLIAFLVTDDHSFFRTFFWSSRAEAILVNLIASTLKIKPSLEVLLAGQVIDGM